MRRNILFGICAGAAVVAFVGVIVRESHHRKTEGEKASPQLAGVEAAAELKSTESQKQFDWRQLESTDYRAFIKNLRASGSPEQTVRDIVIAEINRLFDSKEKAAALTNHVEYWRMGDVLPRQRVKVKLTEQHERFESERMAILEELLGEGADIEPRPANISDAEVKLNLLDFMPLEERPKALETINEIDATYDTKFAPRIGPG